MNRKVKKIILYLVLFITGSFAVLFITIYSLLQLSLPELDGEIIFSNIKEKIEITYDSMGVAQIWAKNSHDGYFSLGYLHASDRLFQMELIRKVAQGRISEILGDVSLKEDIRQRSFGHNRIAKDALDKLSPKNDALLSAYAKGVNAYVENCRAMPIEFYILQIDFENLTVYDCLTILNFQTWFSDALMNRDMFFLKLSEHLGREEAKKLTFRYPDWAPVTISESKSIGYDNYYPNKFQDDLGVVEQATKKNKIDFMTPDFYPLNPAESFRKELANSLYGDGHQPFLMTEASNAWSVSPALSKSKKAMLASDPHLEISRLPQFWHYSGLHIEDDSFNVVGISLAGLPLFPMGHNGKAAYAFTAGGVDITDYYLEKINPDDSSQYLTKNGWENFKYIQEEIKVGGIDTSLKVQIKFTTRGPLLAEEDSLKNSYSVKWAGFDNDLNEMLNAGLSLPKINCFENFRQIVTSLGSLNANWIYADINDNIGYQLGTPIPQREYNNSAFPRNGWEVKNENGWTGYYPLELTPHSLNPAEGWIGNCNNLAGRNDLPFDIPGNYFVDRILRLNELFYSQENLTVDDMKEFQMDISDSYLMRFKQIASSILAESGHSELADSLSDWDGVAGQSSREVLLLELFLSQLIKLTFEDELGDLYMQVRKIWYDQIYFGDDQAWFNNINTSDKIETKNDISFEAMKQALKIAGNDNWGERHSLTMSHPLSAVPILGSLLDLKRGPWSWRGTAGTLNASFFIKTDDNRFKSFVGPSWRFLIDFSDVDSATMVIPAGNSGNPASDYFFNFNSLWQSGERWNVPISREKVFSRAKTVLVLSRKK